MKNVAFIINPKSSGKSNLPFLDELKKKVADPKFYISDSVKATQKFIENNLPHTEIFVAVGGDGTISTIASALINTGKIMAVYPAGSGNGFARETGFSKDLDALLEKIKEKKLTEIDTVTINGIPAVNMAGVGFDGKVAKEFEKTRRGFLNYIKVSFEAYLKYKPVSIDFFDENLKAFNGKYLMLNVANSRQFGNNAYIAPFANLSDGLAELVLVRKFPLWYAAVFAYRMFTKRLRADRYVKYLKTADAKLTISTTDWHVDGEYTHIESPIAIEVHAASLRILC